MFLTVFTYNFYVLDNLLDNNQANQTCLNFLMLDSLLFPVGLAI
jgi:hypothetical protein